MKENITLSFLKKQVEEAQKVNNINILSSLPSSSLDSLLVYTNLLYKWSKKINLISPVPLEDIIYNHILDSLVGFFLVFKSLELKEGDLVLDLGSGAGLPGLVSGISYPSLNFILLEPREKRVFFLKEVIRVLGLKNIKVIRDRIENLDSKLLNSLSLITERAVRKDLDIFLTKKGILKENTNLALFLSPILKEEAIKLISKKRKFFSLLPYHIPPNNKKRNILITAKP